MVSGTRSKSTALEAFLFLPLLIAAILWFSGCATVVGSGTLPQSKSTPLVISASSLPGGTAQKAYSASLAATGGTAPYSWSVTQGSLPTGVSISDAGQISGTPTHAGTSTLAVQVTDSSSPAKTATANLSIVVAPAATSVQITTSSLLGGRVSVAYSASLAASGGTSPYSWSISSGSLPVGLSLNPSSGVIAGTPSQAGSFAFTVKLSDSSAPAQTAVANFTMSFAAADPPLEISTSSLPGGEIRSVYVATLSATGGNAPYNWSLASGALPNGLTLSATGTISGTPSQNGNFAFKVQVEDSSSPMGTITRALNISIALTGGTLQITTPAMTPGQANVAYSTTLVAIGGANPYSWSIAAGALPAGLTLNSVSGIIGGTPTQSGIYFFTIQVQDGATTPQTVTKSFSLNVASAVTPLQLTTTALVDGQLNSAYGATLTASGGTTPYSWSISSGSLPVGLTLNSSTGQISGTPTTSGTASFTVQVKDAANNTGTKALSIAVAATAQPPTVTTSSLSGATVGTSYSTALQASGGTTPYTWSVTAGTLPAGLSLTASTGVISGTPTTTGTASFTVQVSDAANNTATKSLGITISPIGSQPQTDQYGGLIAVPCVNTNTAFAIVKVGNNLVFCTPQGHAMFARGFYVMDLNLGVQLDETGGSYNQYVLKKYGNAQTWYTQELNRMQSWGMNAVGPYGNANLYPSVGQTTKVPFVLYELASSYSLVNKLGWGTGAAKEMYKLLGSQWGGFVGSTGIADYRDPNWAGMVSGVLNNDWATGTVAAASAANKGYLLGFSFDDSDGLHGFGAGPDFPTQPAGFNDFRYGYMGFFMAPTDYANSSQGQIYPDATVYLKKRFHDLLVAKYGTVNALNNAWGSGYSTLDSSGTCIGTAPVACASNLSAESVGTGNGSTKSFSTTLSHPTVSRFSLGIFVGGVLVGGDSGDGIVYGPSVNGSVNYSTGALSLNFGTAPGANVTVNYIQNGWGIGSGFMDEDCRNSHSSYCGDGSANATIYLTGVSANAQTDLNALSKDTAAYYSSTINSKIQAWGAAHGFTGHIPHLGPTTLGTWSAPPDRYVLQGFAGNVDAWQYGGMGTFSQAELDFVNTHMGDVGLIEGEYRTANADSPYAWPNSTCTHSGSTVSCTIAAPNHFSSFAGSFHIDSSCNQADYNIMNVNYSATSSTVTYSAAGTPSEPSATCKVFFDDANVGGFATQAARGQDFFNKVSLLPSRSFTATGTHPYLGYFWWQYFDNEAEKLNWGPMSLRDNAYDGNEAVNPTVVCSDPTPTYNCGGELRGPYGSLIPFLKSTNTTIDNTLLALP